MRTSRWLTLSLLAAAAGLTLSVARADDLDVPGLLTSAKTSFEGKHYGKAMADLALAAGEVSRLRTETLKAKLPAAPTGWTAEEAQGQGGLGLLGMGSLTQVTRRYAKGDATSVQVELTADAAALVAPIQMMLSNPAFLGQDAKVVTVKGRKALAQGNAEAKTASLTLLLNTPNSLLKLDGNGVSKADLDAFAATIDLDALEKAVAD